MKSLAQIEFFCCKSGPEHGRWGSSRRKCSQEDAVLHPPRSEAQLAMRTVLNSWKYNSNPGGIKRRLRFRAASSILVRSYLPKLLFRSHSRQTLLGLPALIWLSKSVCISNLNGSSVSSPSISLWISETRSPCHCRFLVRIVSRKSRQRLLTRLK